MPVTIIPSKANRIRAAIAAEPQLTRQDIAAKLGVTGREVDVVLARPVGRRVKSIVR